MYVKNPEYFLTVARERSISKAAEKLYLSQPYLSQCIARLERELGLRLFDRSHSPLTLTEAGELYLSYLEKMGSLSGSFESQLQVLKDGGVKTLNVGMTLWRGSVLLPDILPSYTKVHPDVRVVVHEYYSSQLTELLLEGKIDFALMNSPNNMDELVYDMIFHERMLLVVNRENPLIQGMETSVEYPAPIDLQRMKGERFILLPREHVMGQAMENLFVKQNMSAAEKLFITSSTTAVNLVSAGFGVTFLPEGGIRQVSHLERLAFFTVDDPPFSVPLLFLYKKNAVVSPQARDFIRMTREYYAQLERQAGKADA